MNLSTPFTTLLGIHHPIALAPMGGSAGGALAAAVSRAGGLGLLGAGYGDLEWLDRELPLVADQNCGAWGAGFLTWALGHRENERSFLPAGNLENERSFLAERNSENERSNAAARSLENERFNASARSLENERSNATAEPLENERSSATAGSLENERFNAAAEPLENERSSAAAGSLEKERSSAAAEGGKNGRSFPGATAVQRVLDAGARAVMFSFGDPGPFVEQVRAAGAILIIQVTDLNEARRAVELGADVIVAQGTEAGGHGALRGRSIFSFLPAVVDLARPTPVLAAGGIADGRGLAAVLALGAAGALIGTRFQATTESLAGAETVRAIVDGRSEETERNRILDIARGSDWPSRYSARTLAHPYLDRWRGREAELAADPHARQAYQDDVARGMIPALPVWAGEGVDLITDVPAAGDLVDRLVSEARQALGAPGDA